MCYEEGAGQLMGVQSRNLATAVYKVIVMPSHTSAFEIESGLDEPCGSTRRREAFR